MAILGVLSTPLANCATKLSSSSTTSFATGTSSVRLVANGSALTFNNSTAAAPQRLQVTASKKLIGKVVTDTNDKSVTVEVVRIAVWPKYGKRVRRVKNFIVHDPENAAKKGDMVSLAKCAPVSKRKSFVVIEIKRGHEDVPVSDTFTGTTSIPPFESATVAA